MSDVLSRLRRKWTGFGPTAFVHALYAHLASPTSRLHPECRSLVEGRHGLEIGGPSEIFGPTGLLPLYRSSGSLDNCNFAARTVWEGEIQAGSTFHYNSGKPPGLQIVAEASRLSAIPSEAYDFVLSSHVLEHLANPLRALSEWRRVLRPGGGLLLVVPHRDGTFDHRRPVTTLSHLVEDESAGTEEDDLTHLDEILALHDLKRDPGAGSRAEFEARCRKNLEFRCLHHHVFTTELLLDVVCAAGFDLVVAEARRPHHIIVVATKADGPVAGDWRTRVLVPACRRSPFASDRHVPLDGSLD